jgi:hypothetical protein
MNDLLKKFLIFLTTIVLLVGYCSADMIVDIQDKIINCSVEFVNPTGYTIDFGVRKHTVYSDGHVGYKVGYDFSNYDFVNITPQGNYTSWMLYNQTTYTYQTGKQKIKLNSYWRDNCYCAYFFWFYLPSGKVLDQYGFTPLNELDTVNNMSVVKLVMEAYQAPYTTRPQMYGTFVVN